MDNDLRCYSVTLGFGLTQALDSGRPGQHLKDSLPCKSCGSSDVCRFYLNNDLTVCHRLILKVGQASGQHPEDSVQSPGFLR